MTSLPSSVRTSYMEASRVSQSACSRIAARLVLSFSGLGRGTEKAWPFFGRWFECFFAHFLWREDSKTSLLMGRRFEMQWILDETTYQSYYSIGPNGAVKTFELSSENHPQNVPLHNPKLHYGAIFQPAIPETWQECLYTTLYCGHNLCRFAKTFLCFVKCIGFMGLN